MNGYHGSDESFRRTTIHTTADDIQRKECPELSPNLIDTAYEDSNHYLKTQFDLLREELVRPLVDDVQRLRQKLSSISKDERGRHLKTLKEVVDNDTDIQSNVYFKVKLVSDWSEECVDRRHGPLLRFTFDYQSLENVDLADCQRLMDGSLLCLSSDRFESSLIFGVVFKSRLNYKDSKSKQTIWDFCLKVDLDDNECEDFFTFILSPNTKYIAIESLTYFEGITHSLSGLQKMSPHFPFNRYIVHLIRNLRAPPYLNPDSCYDMSCIAPDISQVDQHTDHKPNPLSSVQLLNAEHKSVAKKASIFDGQQFEAYYHALTKEFAVIQGPPGTGKTFVGLKIVKCLLDNEKVWNPSADRRPILIVCFKNHALDQFLEGILKFSQNVVRIGGKSDSEALDNYKLREIKERYRSLRKNPELESLDNAFPIKGNPIVLNARSKLNRYYGRINGIKGEMEELLDKIRLSFLYIVDYEQIAPDIRPMNRKFIEYFNSRYNNHNNPVLEWLSEGNNVFDLTNLSKKRLSFICFTDIVSDILRKDKNGVEVDINELETAKKWYLYLFWRENYFKRMRNRIAVLDQTFKDEVKGFNRKNAKFERLLCNEAQVIGLTITGAAKYRDLVDEFNPQIMIIEEAAEVLEGHVVASFPSRLEHVILVGDHKQLRPITNVRQLTTDYNLDKSLFERMVTNGMPFKQLELQHRMAPCISELLKVAHIYDNLRNAQKVTVYPNIKYVFNKNMYFIDHNHIEDSNHSREVVDKSRSNLHEAKLVVELVKYFLQHQYSGDKITVLTTYNAQLTIIKRLMFDQKDVFVKESADDDPIRLKRADGKESPPELKVRVSSVDGFQGEENDIIIISFVRSSKKGTIGFLENINRVNVALSRARHGLYCVGNFNTMATQSDMWQRIVDHLQTNQSMNQKFVIGCDCTGEEHIEMPGQFELLNLQIRNGRCKCHMNSS